MTFNPLRLAFLLLLAAPLAAAVTAPGLRAAETREALALDFADREHLLAGMRRYLQSVQDIVERAAASDMPGVAKAARTSGAAMVKDVSLSAIVGLPPDFLLSSMATHQKFDELADTAEAGGPRQAVLDRLGEILATCNACHAMYRMAER